jgi:hypothetical protein
MGSVTEWFVDGSAAAAQSYFLSRFNAVAAGVEKSDLPGDQVWTFGQHLNRWIRHYLSPLEVQLKAQ